MELESLFGLPAHPLLVHGAVVLVPLVAIGTVLIVASAKQRRQLGMAVAILAVVSFGFTFLAKESGEPLEEKVDETQLVAEHAELGETMPLFAGLLMLTTIGVVAVDRYGRRFSEPSTGEDAATDAPLAPSWLKPATIAVSVLAVLASVGATVQVAQVGHSGAKATWSEEGGEGGESGESGESEGAEEEGLAPTAVDSTPVRESVEIGQTSGQG